MSAVSFRVSRGLLALGFILEMLGSPAGALAGAGSGEAAAPNGTCGSGSWTPGYLEIHHINIGQGDSTLIVSPTGKTLLFDAGESYWNSHIDADTMGAYIYAVLGCKQLDYVVISHFHLDHIGYVGYGGLWHLVEEQGFTVGTTLLRDYNTYMGTSSGTFDNWKTYLEGPGQATLHPVTAVEGSGQVDLGGGVIFQIVTVDGNGVILPGDFNSNSTPPSENDYSIGAVVRFGDFDEWIGGDLDGQYYVTGFGYAYHDIEVSVAPEVGDVDVYRVNHHGSDHSSSAAFVNQLDPEISIVSVGYKNPYGHPRQSVMDLLNATSTVYLTERGDPTVNIGSAIVAGHIVIRTSDGSSYTINGVPQTATEPMRTDADGDGYFVEVDPDDNDPTWTPAPYGGCNRTYQPCPTTCQLHPGQVVVNEVLPAPSTGNSEWIELYNTTNDTLDLSYCYVDDEAGGSQPVMISVGTLLAPHGFWTKNFSNFFNNSGDEARLLTDNSPAPTILDSYAFGSNSGIYDLSWYRLTDGGGWSIAPTSSPTKGRSNVIVTSTFADVPPEYWAWQWIERLYAAGITGGCGTDPLIYCPDEPVTRAQMAVFLERGMNGSGYVPPAGTGLVFADVPDTQFFVNWIEKLYLDGITGGCWPSPLMYCPDNAVTREQMAIFLLRSKYGAGYMPPEATGTVFLDVPASSIYARWIEQLASEEVTSGCGGGNYCPEASVTRDQMAVFLVRIFRLP